ncbi:hypothetical protein BC939DRAFT_441431 [Gamsiella multidivaricata]|uniref:uncharacterized protein n=1 Tax=Gamsiella multidivaricata TaxID=101098 RepID=UPI002220755B|nr:uncharacterized protein BC939DRAFT_441431 [Gamsiella multidivaricata]KAI7829669.1 hypothetical protein BC939DRAFT_441431 [Gamsiella multidivaricata]
MAKVSNFEGWQLAAQAWSEVKPQSIRNCFAHVPILNDDQKKELRTCDEIDANVQAAIRDAREDIADRASMMNRYPRMTLEQRFPGAFGPAICQSTQNSSLVPATYTSAERDYYTRLSALLDGSTFLNDVIHQRRKNSDFMECFAMEPRTVPLDELFPDEDDTDDEDYGNDSTSMRQPGAAVQSLETCPLSQLLEAPRLGLTTSSSTLRTSDVLVLTEGAILLAPGTIVAPSGSIVAQRTLQTKHQFYAWPTDDLRSSDISEPEFL